jgi:hypothetical protein
MDMRSVLESRGHAVAISASAVLLAAVVAHAALGSDGDRDALDVRAAAARSVLNTNPVPEFVSPDFSGIAGAWDVASIVSPEGKRAFVSAPKPRVTARVIPSARPDSEPSMKTLPAAPVPVAAISPGRVTLKWGAVAAGPGVAAISAIRVWRQAAGEREPALVATLPGNAVEWADDAVRPRATYEYRLQLSTTQETADGARESARSGAVAATSPSDADIVFTGGSDSVAIIVVRKWSGGEWQEETFMVRPRDEQEGRDGVIGGVIVKSNRKVDFSSGFILNAIRRETRRFAVQVLRNRLEGGVLIQVAERLELSRESLRIDFTDDTGARRHLWQNDPLPAGAEPLTPADR